MFDFLKSLYHLKRSRIFDLSMLSQSVIQPELSRSKPHTFEYRLEQILLNQLLFLAPKQAKTHHLLSIHYAKNKQFKRSLMHAKMAYTLAPFELHYRENWINALLINGAYHLAKREVEKLLYLNAEEPKYQKALQEINQYIDKIDEKSR